MSFRIVSSCVLMAAIACANPPVVSSGAAAGAEPAPAPNRDRNLITQAELSDPSIRAQSVLSVIRTMRPHFLVERGKNSHSDDEAGKVHVSVDNGRIVPLTKASITFMRAPFRRFATSTSPPRCASSAAQRARGR